MFHLEDFLWCVGAHHQTENMRRQETHIDEVAAGTIKYYVIIYQPGLCHLAPRSRCGFGPRGAPQIHGPSSVTLWTPSYPWFLQE